MSNQRSVDLTYPPPNPPKKQTTIIKKEHDFRGDKMLCDINTVMLWNAVHCGLEVK